MRLPAMMIAVASLAVAAQAATPANPPAKTVSQEVVVKQIVHPGDGEKIDSATPEAKAVMAQCSAQKFETSAVVGEGSAKRVTRIKLCAKLGENDAQWVATLHKALDRVEDMSEISAESRAQISAQLKAEIARLEAAAAKPAN